MDTTPRQERLAKAETMRANATLLLVRARHDSMKEQVRLASRDLAEALRWLATPTIDQRPAVLSLVDVALRAAGARLSLVDDALRTRGPDAAVTD